MPILFLITLICFAIVIILGLYFHSQRVLPALRENPEFLPSKQFQQVERYLEQLPKEECKGFGYHFLKNEKTIQTLLIFLWLVAIVQVIFQD